MRFAIFSRLFDRIVALVAKVSLFAILLAGLACIIASVAFALYTPTKLLAVLTAAIGCSLGTGIIAMTLPKQAAIKIDEERRQIEEAARNNARIEEQLTQFARLEAEREKLQSEIERHKRMRVDVNSYRAILKLGVAELDSQVTDFKKDVLGEERRDQWYQPGRSEVTEYIGVLHYRYRAFLGVDLTKLRFRDCEDGTLEVSGLESEFQGMKDQKKQWLLREIRQHKLKKNPLPEDYQVLPQDGRLVDKSDAQENELIDRINNGTNFKSLDSHIIKMAAEFTRLLLAPMGKTIVFAKNQNLEGVGFLEYLAFHNIALDKQVRQLEEKKAHGLLLPQPIHEVKA